MDVAEEWYDDMGAEADLGYSGTAPDLQKGRKITFSASLSINTKTFDADYAKINKLIVQTGGYVSSENTTDNWHTDGTRDGNRCFRRASRRKALILSLTGFRRSAT